MGRITIDMPEPFVFSTDLTVRVSEINYGNHLGNDRMVTMLHQARLEYINSLGFSEFDIGGYGIVITDLAVVFKAEAFLNEQLTFKISLGDFNKYGCDLFYRVSKQNDQTLVADAKTGIVFFDYSQRKIAQIPKAFTEKYKQSIE